MADRWSAPWLAWLPVEFGTRHSEAGMRHSRGSLGWSWALVGRLVYGRSALFGGPAAVVGAGGCTFEFVAVGPRFGLRSPVAVGPAAGSCAAEPLHAVVAVVVAEVEGLPVAGDIVVAVEEMTWLRRFSGNGRPSLLACYADADAAKWLWWWLLGRWCRAHREWHYWPLTSSSPTATSLVLFPVEPLAAPCCRRAGC